MQQIPKLAKEGKEARSLSSHRSYSSNGTLLFLGQELSTCHILGPLPCHLGSFSSSIVRFELCWDVAQIDEYVLPLRIYYTTRFVSWDLVMIMP
ncbi:unnamed protein product [Linum trigynum]|uniref:Uncharacterized protein n=1 Tax=Linum trigynum TaxID=586398 RepID=A0AAV2F4D3_9ROSI